MTDDFRLFADEHDVDPDIAIVTAYLAGELTMVQVSAIEERLVKDADFRLKVQPVIDAWVQPVSFAPGATRLPALHGKNVLLSPAEVNAGWDRYMRSRETVPAGPRLASPHAEAPFNIRRTRTMTRIAAMIAAAALPVIGIAQAVVYAAHHDTVPGHRVARAVVAPFVAPPASLPEGQPPIAGTEDIRLGRMLKAAPKPTARPFATKAESITAPLGALPPFASTPALPGPSSISPTVRPRTLPEPDRKAMAALAERLQPDVVAGKILAGYIVILFDEDGRAIWSTHGIGSVMFEVAGDTRTDAERVAFSQTYAKEFGAATFDRSLVDNYVVVSDKRSLEGMRGVDILTPPDSASKPRFAKARISGDTVNAAAECRERFLCGQIASGYRAGFSIVVDRGTIKANSADGLEIPRNGGSGIVGRPASSIARVDAYFFPKKEISPQILQVYAVYLK